MSAQIKSGCTGHFLNTFVAAQGAFNQATGKLRLKVMLGREPAFKKMMLLTPQVEDFHAQIMVKFLNCRN